MQLYQFIGHKFIHICQALALSLNLRVTEYLPSAQRNST